MFAPGKVLQIVLFVNKAGTYLSGAPSTFSSEILDHPLNLLGANTLAFLPGVSVTMKERGLLLRHLHCYK